MGDKNNRPQGRSLVAERMDHKKAAIMRAALQLFGTHGFHATAVGIIADKAGVAAGTIYRYFADKESLLNELYITHRTWFLSALTQQGRSTIKAREQFRWLWTALYKYSEEHEQSFTFLELQFHAQYLSAASLKADDDFRALFREFFERARTEGVVKDLEPDLLTAMLLGAFANLVKQHQMRRIQLTQQAVTEAEGACWDLIARQP